MFDVLSSDHRTHHFSSNLFYIIRYQHCTENLSAQKIKKIKFKFLRKKIIFEN